MRWRVCAVLCSLWLVGCLADFPPELLPDGSVDAGGDGGAGDGGTADGSMPTGLALNGESCTADSDCFSGHCVAEACCDRACTGTCEQCTSAGVCMLVAEGQSPPAGKSCDAEAVTTCGRDGSCDGRGGCRLHTGTVSPFAGVRCTATGPSCSDDPAVEMTRTLAGVCDGLGGACLTPAGYGCMKYVCADDTCQAPCAGNADCREDTDPCGAGRCGSHPVQSLFPLGALCSGGSACSSTYCVNGVCCENSCTAACRTCGLPGIEGRCVMVPAGLPPNPAESGKSCTDETATNACGQDGRCDGVGGCRKAPAGTPCGGPRCVQDGDSGAHAVAYDTCDGEGGCETAETSCGNYRCSNIPTPTCFGHCVTDAQCASGKSCVNNRCI